MNGRRLIECYIDATCQQRTNDEKVMLDNLFVAPNRGFEKEKEVIDWVKDRIRCPSLMGLARMSIRDAVQKQSDGTSIYEKLWRLPLPTYLKSYVRLDGYEM